MARAEALFMLGLTIGCQPSSSIQLPQVPFAEVGVLYSIGADQEDVEARGVALHAETTTQVAVADDGALELWAYSCGFDDLHIEGADALLLDPARDAPPASAVYGWSDDDWRLLGAPARRPFSAEPPVACTMVQAQTAIPLAGALECRIRFATSAGPDRWLTATVCRDATVAPTLLELRAGRPDEAGSVVVTAEDVLPHYSTAADAGGHVWLASDRNAVTASGSFSRLDLIDDDMELVPRAPFPRALRDCPEVEHLGLEDQVKFLRLRGGGEPGQVELYLISECGLARYTEADDRWRVLASQEVETRHRSGVGVIYLGPGRAMATGVEHGVYVVNGDQVKQLALGDERSSTLVRTRGEQIFAGDEIGGLWRLEGQNFVPLGIPDGVRQLDDFVPFGDGFLAAVAQPSLYQYLDGAPCPNAFNPLLAISGEVELIERVDDLAIAIVQTQSENDPGMVVLAPPKPLRCDRKE